MKEGYLNLHPKLRKNLYDINHNRQLERSHTIINLGLTSSFFLAGLIITLIIEKYITLNLNIVFFILIGIATIFSVTWIYYRASKKKRLEILKLLEDLNPVAKDI